MIIFVHLDGIKVSMPTNKWR